MTDSEINTLIADIDGRCSTPDYCNNWADIGPIIEREKIKLFSSEGVDWKATLVKPCSELGYRVWMQEAETPTKAAALCYLKMRESEW